MSRNRHTAKNMRLMLARNAICNKHSAPLSFRLLHVMRTKRVARNRKFDFLITRRLRFVVEIRTVHTGMLIDAIKQAIRQRFFLQIGNPCALFPAYLGFMLSSRILATLPGLFLLTECIIEPKPSDCTLASRRLLHTNRFVCFASESASLKME